MMSLAFLAQISPICANESKEVPNIFRTSIYNCGSSCFEKPGRVNCIESEKPFNSVCCNYIDPALQERCMSRFDLCSLGLSSNLYKMLTCPMYNCPNDNQLLNYMHSSYNNAQEHQLEWNFRFHNTNAYNCRLFIRADRGLNGKLTIELLETA